MVIKQGMQGVERDAGGPEVGGELEQAREVGEVATAPVAPRPYAIKLHRQRPQAPGSSLAPWKACGGALSSVAASVLSLPEERATTLSS